VKLIAERKHRAKKQSLQSITDTEAVLELLYILKLVQQKGKVSVLFITH